MTAMGTRPDDVLVQISGIPGRQCAETTLSGAGAVRSFWSFARDHTRWRDNPGRTQIRQRIEQHDFAIPTTMAHRSALPPASLA